MNRFCIATPEGTRDRLFASCRALRQTQAKICAALSDKGYREVITPSVEYYDVFLQAGTSLGQETMLKVIDRSGRICVLRPDNTTPIARIASTKLQNFPTRLYYCQNVFRSNDGNNGHRAEVLQVGAELLGVDGMMADFDILSAAFEALEASGTAEFSIEVGHAGIYKGLISSLGIENGEAEEIRRLIENKSFAALGDVLEPYKGNEAYAALKAMPTLFGGAEVLDDAEELTQNEQVRGAIAYLRDILGVLDAAGYGDRVMVDLGLVHEMDYYTGIMFRGYTGGAGSTILSGGRYNSLCGKFGKPLAAIGFAIDLESVSETVQRPEENTPDEAVFCAPENLQAALAYLRQAGGRAVLAPCDSEAEASAYAKSAGISALCVITADGTAKKEVQ